MALNYTAIAALTTKKYIPEMVDNFFKSNPLLVVMKNIESTFPGGFKVVEPLVYGDINAVQAYELYDELTYDTTIPVSAAEFSTKNNVATIIISKDEELQNEGETQVKSLVKAKVEIVEKSLKSAVVSQLYGDGTDVKWQKAGRNIGLDGLGAAISATGVFGGIDRTENPWWRCRVLSNHATTPGTPAALSLEKMKRMYLSLSDGTDQPDIILCGTATWLEYWNAVETKTQLTTPMGQTMLKYGFQTLEFMGKPVVADMNCPEGIMYFLNTKYLKWRPHKSANFATTPFRPDDSRLAMKQEILLTAALTMNNSRRFGKLVDIAYTAL